MSVDRPEQLDTKQTAQLLNVTPERIKQLIRAGQLQARMISGRWVLERAEVERFIEQGGCKGRTRPPARKRIEDEWTEREDLSRQMKHYLRRKARRMSERRGESESEKVLDKGVPVEV